MLEIVRAFNWLITQGKAIYWATSMWSAERIEEAHRKFSRPIRFQLSHRGGGHAQEVAEKYNLHAPVSAVNLKPSKDSISSDPDLPFRLRINLFITF